MGFVLILELSLPAIHMKGLLQVRELPVLSLDLELGPAPGQLNVLRVDLSAVGVDKEPGVVHRVVREADLGQSVVSRPLVRNNGGAGLADLLNDGQEDPCGPFADNFHVVPFPFPLEEAEHPLVRLAFAPGRRAVLEATLVDLHNPLELAHRPDEVLGYLLVQQALQYHRVGLRHTDEGPQVLVLEPHQPEENEQKDLFRWDVDVLPDALFEQLVRALAGADEEELLVVALAQSERLAAAAGFKREQ